MAKKSSWRSRLFLLFALAAALLLLAFLHTQRLAKQALAFAPDAVYFTVDKGDGLNKILPKMRAAGITKGADWQWKVLAMQMRIASKIHVGDYKIQRSDSPTMLLHKLAIGDTARIKFTIIEGWNFKLLIQQIKDIPELNDDISALSADALMQMVNKKGVHPEGRFLPDTYFVPLSGKKSQILIEAANAMDKALADAWMARQTGLPLKNADELLILASIVEKETGVANERPQIAGVFVRRLQKGMRLETDPTVIYGMGSAYDGNIRKKDLRTVTPYNTYRIKGLPPTPIAMPGKAALQAAANPAPGDSLFFVANGKRAHIFSSTYAEHKKAVQAYQIKSEK
jgi:UPF0755 protein